MVFQSGLLTCHATCLHVPMCGCALQAIRPLFPFINLKHLPVGAAAAAACSNQAAPGTDNMPPQGTVAAPAAAATSTLSSLWPALGRRVLTFSTSGGTTFKALTSEVKELLTEAEVPVDVSSSKANKAGKGARAQGASSHTFSAEPGQLFQPAMFKNTLNSGALRTGKVFKYQKGVYCCDLNCTYDAVRAGSYMTLYRCMYCHVMHTVVLPRVKAMHILLPLHFLASSCLMLHSSYWQW